MRGLGPRLLSCSAQLGIPSPGSCTVSAEEASSQSSVVPGLLSQDALPLGYLLPSELFGSSWAPKSHGTFPSKEGPLTQGLLGFCAQGLVVLGRFFKPRNGLGSFILQK